MRISPQQLATAIHVPIGRPHAIIQGEHSITTDTALRLSRYFGTIVQFCVNMQATYELEVAAMQFGDQINLEILPLQIWVVLAK